LWKEAKPEENSWTVISQLDSIIYNNSFNKSNEPTQCFIEIFCIESCFDTDTLYIMSNSTVLALYFRKRKEFIGQFIPIFNTHHQAITVLQETVQLVYESHYSKKTY
jgi:DNA replication and repair protein RecF